MAVVAGRDGAPDGAGTVIPLLFLVPAAVSLALGIVFVVLGEARGALKGVVVVVFGLAAWLQFATRHELAGMLLQIALALYLALWMRLQRTA